MLSKVSDISIDWPWTKLQDFTFGQALSSSYSWRDFKIMGQAKGERNYGDFRIYSTLKSGNTWLGERSSIIGWYQDRTDFTMTWTLDTITNITSIDYRLHWGIEDSYSLNYIRNTALYGIVTIPKWDGINGKPRELKSLWNKTTTTIFGVHIDGSRITQE